MSKESWEIRIMRAMAWDRAKGELKSITNTFLSGGTSEEFEIYCRLLDDFIKAVEENSLLD